MTQMPFDGFFPFSVGINPEPVPFNIKLALIGDSFIYSLLSTYDSEFNPVIHLSDEVLEDLSHAVSKIIKEEKLRHF